MTMFIAKKPILNYSTQLVQIQFIYMPKSNIVNIYVKHIIYM